MRVTRSGVWIPAAAVALLSLGWAAPGAVAGEARVEVAEGLVTARFEAVAIPEAVAAIRRAAGLEVVLPGSVQGKTVTLAVEQLPLERFIRRVLDLLDVGGYALVYDSAGETRRLIVVESAPGMPVAGAEARPGGSGGATPPAAPPGGRSPLGAPATHASPVVLVEPTGIRITPRGQYDRLDLVVAGRDGRMVRRQFQSGSAAFFDVLDEQGKPLGDGSYNYELVVVPLIPAEIRERMHAVRESPDDRTKLELELRAAGWLPKEPIIQSGHFSVTGGLIVDGSAQEGARRR